MNLFIRILSALAGSLALAGTTYFGGPEGLALLSGLAVLVSQWELDQMVVQRKRLPRAFKMAYRPWPLICTFIIVFYSLEAAFLFISCALAFFWAAGVWLIRDGLLFKKLLRTLGIGALGIIYCGVFPAFALKLLFLKESPIPLFFSLLVLVFSGDTFAYFGGRLLGKTKIHPASPGKTLAGFVAGVIGTTVIGSFYFYTFLPQSPIYWVIPFCILTSAVAQSGDLFVSLIKRVADVKDSGKVLPGHGGLLDRLDGVFMASPLVYTFAFLLQTV